ncbi:CheR family methyltransferase [Haliovirga abyssi]|uniref:protein-glutamate O-methyltransferase n=1 Tax=Haliovirga abyssi TaxID=2996794 RepID=A0AAU9DG36_9FUSO|nr:protein-glutamate O-methyltransferase CheR [Haliovirga abyssi]BDU49634.1 chemotaxis protein methyltransferase [Haliovirga abyssi]
MKLRANRFNLNKVENKVEMEFGLNEFRQIRDIIYDYAGIYINENKLYFLKKRIEDRMEIQNMNNVNEYINFLKYFDKAKKEMNELMNSVTINETYFFREFEQLKVFGEYGIDDVLKNKGRFNKKIRVLSAGCSTGAEPYTLSIILKELLEEDEGVDFEIVGIDIDDNVLDKAKKGIYDKRSIKYVPISYLKKYFIQDDAETFRVINSIKEKVKFYKKNLTDSNGLLALGYDFDFLFCRNVLIYFDSDSRRKVIETYYKMMNDGGYIYLGHSESLSRITTAFKLKRMGGQLVYQKPIRGDEK